MIKQPNSWRNTKIHYKSLTEVTEKDLKNNTLFLVGAFQAHSVLQGFLKNTPFKMTNRLIQIELKEST